MNTLETLITLNAVTPWGLTRLKKALYPGEDIPHLSLKDDFNINNLKSKLLPKHTEIRNKLLNVSEYIDLSKEVQDCGNQNIQIIPFYDGRYPQDLLHIYDPPLILYVRGNIDFNASLSIAVVGSRKASNKGRSFAFKIAADLAASGIAVVSGLAYGIDAEAHRGALSANGKTIAVLGSGLMEIYPKEHKNLSESILSNGSLISEFPVSTLPAPYHFPRRNRIISGLSAGVLVVEAAEKSGSLITARFANEQGRDVFSVPGSPMDKYSAGTNALIKDGAKLTTCADDILNELEMQGSLPLPGGSGEDRSTSWKSDTSLTNDEKSILSCMSVDPLSLDSISVKSNVRSKNVSHILLTLELKKYIKVYPGNRYGLNYRR